MRTISPSTRILLAGLALGLCADLLFHGRAPGVSVPLFVVLVLGALFVLGRQAGVPPARRNLWLALPLLFFAAMVAVRANPFLTFLNLAAVLALLAFVAHFYAGGRPEAQGLVGYALVLLRAGANALFQAASALGQSLPRRRVAGRGRTGAVLRGALLALPVLLVFTLLLSSADLVFRRYVADLLQWRFWQELVGRLIVILVVGWTVAGGLAYSLARGREEQPGLLDGALASIAGALRTDAAGDDGLQKLLAALGAVLSVGMLEAAMVLVPVGLLFAAFVGIQFAYLFGGEANITAQGYTYADYARRGFFELVLVALLTLALVLLLQWLTRRPTSRERRAFNGLGSLLVGLVLVMLASAFLRLRLYELAYGFTETRLYVYVFMAWLGAGLLWFLATLWRRPQRFAIGAFAAALGFLITLNAINPDAFVARQNLARYQATGKIDAAYLTTLSEDALPVLVEAAGQTSGEEQRVLQGYLARCRPIVGLARRQQGWPAFHLAHWQAETLLAAEGGGQ